MAVRVSPEQATSKWVQNISAAGAAITQGVNGVTQAPGQAAAAQADKWLLKVQASKDKWKSRVGSVSLQSWQQSMINVGIPRVASGAQAKQAKFTAFATQFFPHLESGLAKIKAMPSTTLEDNIARATAMIRHNAAFKRTGVGS